MNDQYDDDLWSDSTEPRPASTPRRINRPPRPSAVRISPPAPASAQDRYAELAHDLEDNPKRRRGALGAVMLVLLGAILGGGGAALAANRMDKSDNPGQTLAPVTTTAPGPTAPPTSGTAPAPPPTTAQVAETTVVEAPGTTVAAPPAGQRDDLAIARKLAPMTLPSDCGLPITTSESLPNADRGYRGGVHEGIDFICGERGRNAVAARAGRVVMANASYVDPTNDQRKQILATAKALGYTPPWTLGMLFGRFVVLDHGIVDGVGHVTTIYAHLNEIDSAIKPGVEVKAGQRLGEIGNLGTETAATGGTRPQSLHLHWEIHINNDFLSKGESQDRIRQIYKELFAL